VREAFATAEEVAGTLKEAVDVVSALLADLRTAGMIQRATVQPSAALTK
jgi:hypothetical protein